MIRILGRRLDGVLLVDIGSQQVYAVDVKTRRIAKLGDSASPQAMGAEWQELPREEAVALRSVVQRVLDRPTKLVDYRYIVVPPAPVAQPPFVEEVPVAAAPEAVPVPPPPATPPEAPVAVSATAPAITWTNVNGHWAIALADENPFAKADAPDDEEVDCEDPDNADDPECQDDETPEEPAALSVGWVERDGSLVLGRVEAGRGVPFDLVRERNKCGQYSDTDDTCPTEGGGKGGGGAAKSGKGHESEQRARAKYEAENPGKKFDDAGEMTQYARILAAQDDMKKEKSEKTYVVMERGQPVRKGRPNSADPRPT